MGIEIQYLPINIIDENFYSQVIEIRAAKIQTIR